MGHRNASRYRQDWRRRHPVRPGWRRAAHRPAPRYGSHAAMPQLSRDPIVVATALVQALQSIVSRNMDPRQAAVVSVTEPHAGTAYNVIPEEAVLRGTVRTFSDEVAEMIRQRMRAIV